MSPSFDATRRRCLATLAPLAMPWLASAVRAQDGGRVLRVGPGERLRSFGEALREAADGDTLELAAGDYPGDVGVAEQQRLMIRGLGAGAVLRAEGRIAEGKALLVTRGSVTVENLEFRGARGNGNGAGIRFERGQLALHRCRFFDNEMGLLSGHGGEMALTIDACEFGQAPRHEGQLHHLLYAGGIGSLRVSASRFGGGWRGHLLKSRARRTEIRDSFFVDAPQGEASYELEFPNGGDNLVSGNLIVQSALTQNPVIVSMGAEAQPGMTGRLVMTRNTLVNEAGDNAQFVRVWTERLPADTPVRLVDNVFAGPGQLTLPAAWDGGGNRRVELSALRDDLRNYRLMPAAR